MAWLARSLADSLRLDDDDEADGDEEDDDEEEEEEAEGDVAPTSPTTGSDRFSPRDQKRIANEVEIEPPEGGPSRGVKEDLTELTQTFTRQLWGVANFLAPPPSQPNTPSPPSNPSVDEWSRLEPSDRSGHCDGGPRERSSDVVSGSRSDVTEEAPKLDAIDSGSEIGDQDEDSGEEERVYGDAVGVTDEVLAFARNISMHPETWLDFPLDSEDDLDDFEMSVAQREHAVAIEQLAPRLRALRIEFCPCHMTESYFWKVYFVLLHSRLDKHDAEILYTPQVVEARKMWMQELQKQTNTENDWYGRQIYHMKESSDMLLEDLLPGSPSYMHSAAMAYRTNDFEPSKSSISRFSDPEKCPSISSGTNVTCESVAEENAVQSKDTDLLLGGSSKMPVQDFDNGDDDDDWPEEEDSDLLGYNAGVITVGIEEDISFSDLEDDEDVCMPIKSKPVS
ncbi:BSD domain-containing protein [Psidium guajava]|nr:BSD domain-containing protein [Psidium guajava]